MSMIIEPASARFDGAAGTLSGADVLYSEKRLSQLPGIFADREAFAAMDPDAVVYRVAAHQTVAEGTAGGLFFGVSTVCPGRVGDEYFMTKGHLHRRRECAEYYWGISGRGLLLLQSADGVCRAEAVEPGSLHCIPGFTAHRLVNVGEEDLAVGACWSADAGHDYAALEGSGFALRAVCREGKPVLVKNGK